MKTRLVLAILLSLGTFQPGFGADNCDPDPGEVSTGCMLELGEAPGKNLVRGLTGGILDPVELVKTLGPGASSRTWSEGDRDPSVTNYRIAITGALIDIVGVHHGEPPYGVEELAVRDPQIELPCGLKVGQPLRKFITTLAMEGVVSDPDRWDPKRDVHLSWGKMWSAKGVCFGANANIILRLTPSREVREVRWQYFAD